jgi:glycosyltransferase involved in cell wall biosynthesis
MKRLVSIVVFQRNVGTDLFRTISTILRASETVVDLEIEIVVVDDGSYEKPIEEKILEQKKVVGVVFLGESLGVSGAILSALPYCKSDYILPIPGHNMFAEDAISNVLALLGQGDLVIGCRNNLAAERPPIKKLASRVLRDIYRHLTFYYVGDIHGLILYRKSDLLENLKLDGRHANAISVVTPVLARGGKLVQTVAPINQGHDDRISRKPIDSIPHPRNVLHVLNALHIARNIYKNSK